MTVWLVANLKMLSAFGILRLQCLHPSYLAEAKISVVNWNNDFFIDVEVLYKGRFIWDDYMHHDLW